MAAVDDATKSPVPASNEPRAPSKPPPRRSDRPSTRPGGPESLVGKVLSGRYRIGRLLGEGGMGAVYQAEHAHMHKQLAVKVLHPEMSRLPEVVARFEREAMAAAHIDHPNVAAATDFGKLDDGSFFLVLEYVEGKSLRDVIAGGPLDVGRVVHIVRQIASALGRAATLGIVHRDLKPENAMLVARDGDPDFVKVLDFGIAKVPVGELGAATSSAQPALTQLGMVYGTPEYMAPEQALGQTVDARADQYSLGVIAFEMLTGVRPFEHESKVALLGMHVTAPVPSMASKAPGVSVPREVEEIIMRLLAKDPAHRFADARELADALAAVLGKLVTDGRAGAVYLDRAIGSATSGGPASVATTSLREARASLVAVQEAPRIPVRDRVIAYGHRAGESLRRYRSQVSPRAWALGGGAVGAFVFLVLFVRVLTGSRQAPPSVSPDGSTVPSLPTSVPADHELDDKIVAAEGLLARGDSAGAIGQLTGLESAHPSRAEIHRDLERAYSAAGDTKDGLREADLWLKLDPSAAADSRLDEDVRAAAAGHQDAEAAFALLETRMGSAGADILYDLAYSGGRTAAASKARAALAVPDVRARMSPALSVTVELRGANTCEGKKTLLARAGEVGDARTLAVLKTYSPTSGCGFLNLRDCWSCMHRDGSLAATIAIIDSRSAPPP